MERRFLTRGAELGASGAGALYGHAAVFNQEHVLWDDGNLRAVECVKPGAFARALEENQDVRCLFNHSESQMLGRTKSGTLELKEDSIGLYFRTDPPATQIARDVVTLVKRRDISGCSFAFTVTKEKTTEAKKSGKVVRRREIEDLDLYDVGPVTFPAYTGTDVDARFGELRSIMFPNGVPGSVRRLFADLPRRRPSARIYDDADAEDLMLLDVDLRLIRAGLTPRY